MVCIGLRNCSRRVRGAREPIVLHLTVLGAQDLRALAHFDAQHVGERRDSRAISRSATPAKPRRSVFGCGF